MNKFKIVLSAFLLVIGLSTALLTFNLSGKDSFGKIEFDGGGRTSDLLTAAGGGVDSSNDGVAVGLGIISGFSFLSSVLLLNSISKNIKE